MWSAGVLYGLRRTIITCQMRATRVLAFGAAVCIATAAPNNVATNTPHKHHTRAPTPAVFGAVIPTHQHAPSVSDGSSSLVVRFLHTQRQVAARVSALAEQKKAAYVKTVAAYASKTKAAEDWQLKASFAAVRVEVFKKQAQMEKVVGVLI